MPNSQNCCFDEDLRRITRLVNRLWLSLAESRNIPYPKELQAPTDTLGTPLSWPAGQYARRGESQIHSRDPLANGQRPFRQIEVKHFDERRSSSSIRRRPWKGSEGGMAHEVVYRAKRGAGPDRGDKESCSGGLH
ncbi:hypothetical protein ACRE_064540 [Hapsidospora chrysogenum ATCC 11550]|uniref:Uncharacterized protein n=1 Tax=Hapsidospora chrysogenum (strain ATCC 11550 / CBS 779.69 / DSM 880 / IAM 14645 / JCM 23072 / IMI 49137) TaxID=857340 RepID=A0A086T095_HAPC1|nr:hypothetical protein ACRE_064540 [Hapsidospora chrysogenum ATCC 11550]